MGRGSLKLSEVAFNCLLFKQFCQFEQLYVKTRAANSRSLPDLFAQTLTKVNL